MLMPGINQKNGARLALVSREILYSDCFQSADVKLREQSLPSTAVVVFRSEARVAKDRSSAVNIDAVIDIRNRLRATQSIGL
jgi:hypothetical protein